MINNDAHSKLLDLFNKNWTVPEILHAFVHIVIEMFHVFFIVESILPTKSHCRQWTPDNKQGLHCTNVWELLPQTCSPGKLHLPKVKVVPIWFNPTVGLGGPFIDRGACVPGFPGIVRNHLYCKRTTLTQISVSFSFFSTHCFNYIL